MSLSLFDRMSSYKRDKLVQYCPLDDASGNFKNYSRNVTDCAVDGTVQYRNANSVDGRQIVRMSGLTSHVNLYNAALTANFDATKGTIILYGVLDNALWENLDTYFACRIGNANSTNELTIYKSNNGDQVAFRWIYGGTTVTRIINLSNPTVNSVMIAMAWDTVAGNMYVWAKNYNNAIQSNSASGIGNWSAATLNSNICVLGGLSLGSSSLHWPEKIFHYALWNECFTDEDIRILTLYKG